MHPNKGTTVIRSCLDAIDEQEYTGQASGSQETDIFIRATMVVLPPSRLCGGEGGGVVPVHGSGKSFPWGLWQSRQEEERKTGRTISRNEARPSCLRLMEY